jgi:hypothetical protein
MESHYCHKGSKRHYLAAELNIKKMHGLYKDACKKKGLIPVKESKYRHIFCNEYNFSFFIPKRISVHSATFITSQQKSRG